MISTSFVSPPSRSRGSASSHSRPSFAPSSVSLKALRASLLPARSAAGVEVSGWETFDEHPDLILFEGYLTRNNEAFLKRNENP